MPIVFCSLELYLPHCHSLKEKRAVLRKAADRIRSRFNFSVSEIDHQESWQRGRLGCVSIGSNEKKLNQLAEKLIHEAEQTLGGDLLRHEIEFFDYE